MSAHRVGLIGGGIIGLSAAWRLAQAGFAVSVFDRGPLGAEASSAAAGMLAPQLEAHGAGPLLDFCLRARNSYAAFVDSLQAETGRSVDFRQDGALQLAFSESGAATLTRHLDWQRRAGLRAEWLNESEARALEPALAPGFVGAAWLEGEAQVDNRALVTALAEACARRGVRLEAFTAASLTTEGRTAAVSTEHGVEFFDTVVLCAGAWSSGFSEFDGALAQVEPVRGQILSYRTPAKLFSRILSTPDGYLVARSDGRVIVGATMEHVGFDAGMTAEAMQTLAGFAQRWLPQLQSLSPEEKWTGLRPGTRDGLPLIGRADDFDNLVLATGHYRNGILLSDETARAVLRLARGQTLDVRDFGAFAPRRLSGPLGASSLPAA